MEEFTINTSAALKDCLLLTVTVLRLKHVATIWQHLQHLSAL